MKHDNDNTPPLRRAEKRGKTLPPFLQAALEATAKPK